MDVLLEQGVKDVLVVAIGGGGDVASAAMLALALRRLGMKSTVATIVWERFVYDPLPGPVRMNEMVNLSKVFEHSAVVGESSYAVRGGRKVLFQAANASIALGEPVGVIDLWEGAEGMRKGIDELMSWWGAEAVVGVDVGGDVLAEGHEEDLWSPLADFVGLAALSQVKSSFLAVHSLGSDGELSQRYLLERISKVASAGGLLGGRVMNANDAASLRKILEHVRSEASRISLLAFEGFYGEVPMRMGSRSAEVSPLSIVTFVLDPRSVISAGTSAELLRSTTSLEEARTKLNEAGIYTELDLEEDLWREYGPLAQGIDGERLLEVRSRGRLAVSMRKRKNALQGGG
ncbi:MAG: DUF1152 domain-containing protein [Desulfurococcaceae archaeon]